MSCVLVSHVPRKWQFVLGKAGALWLYEICWLICWNMVCQRFVFLSKTLVMDWRTCFRNLNLMYGWQGRQSMTTEQFLKSAFDNITYYIYHEHGIRARSSYIPLTIKFYFLRIVHYYNKEDRLWQLKILHLSWTRPKNAIGIWYMEYRQHTRLTQIDAKFADTFKKRKLPHWEFKLAGISYIANIVPYLMACSIK